MDSSELKISLDVLPTGVPEWLVSEEYNHRHLIVQRTLIESYLKPSEDQGPHIGTSSYNPYEGRTKKQRMITRRCEETNLPKSWLIKLIERYQSGKENSAPIDWHDCQFGDLFIRELCHYHALMCLRLTRCTKPEESVVLLGKRRFKMHGRKDYDEPGNDKWVWTKGRRPTIALLPPCKSFMMHVSDDLRWAAEHYLRCKEERFRQIVDYYISKYVDEEASPEIHDWNVQILLMRDAKRRLETA